MHQSLATLPVYLRKYVVEQNYDAYTSTEHASWRYIMRQLREFLKQHGHPVYVEGLKKTGIPIERIPRITEMHERLSEFGWGAVGVRGFIPSSVFLDLLARRMLPIAADMRTLKHLAYTPAPDIVHEAAGHAPIIADASYRRFLERYAEIAYRALISSEDIFLYEAIRYLSDIKENPDTRPDEMDRAEARLREAYKAMTYLSEAGKVARMAWWTIEYGLVGSMAAPKLYGAGLLSSVGEARGALAARVKKIPLTIACVETSYDITEPQPQLFVAENLDDLPELLGELENDFVFKTGGERGLFEAKRAKTINTVQLESGLSVSGVMVEYLVSERGSGAVDFIKLSGECQICFKEKEIPGQGRRAHSSGFSSPLGRWRAFPHHSPANITSSELQHIGIYAGQKNVTLELENGFCIRGDVIATVFCEGKLALLRWEHCDIKDAHGKIYYQPEWGVFDQLVGEKVVSVFAGPGDREAFGDYYVGDASSAPTRQSPFSAAEKSIFTLFDTLRDLRQRPPGQVSAKDLGPLAEIVASQFPDQWLVALEIVEVAKQHRLINGKTETWIDPIYQNIFAKKENFSPTVQDLLQSGLNIAHVRD